MRKHIRLILLGVALVLLTGYLVLRLTAPGQRIAEKSFAAIQKGMTEEEVEAILGGKDGVYSSGAVSGLYKVPVNDLGGTLTLELGQDLIRLRNQTIDRHVGKEWVGENLSIYVRFDDDGRVMETLIGETFRIEEVSFLDKLRSWLGI